MDDRQNRETPRSIDLRFTDVRCYNSVWFLDNILLCCSHPVFTGTL